MRLSYTIYDPTKNITLLVETPVPRRLQPAAAAALMARLPQVEQVGFLEPPASPAARLRLQMMGGEFCGNATMSAACFLAEQAGLGDGVFDLPLEVSGAGALTCRLERQGGVCRGTVSMPLPTAVGVEPLPLGGVRLPAPTVRFPGIVHCVLSADALDRAAAEAAIRPLCAVLGADACGLLLLDRDALFFRPLVYVAATDTAVWESGCGSGSAALGCCLAAEGRRGPAALAQPGGVMEVLARWDGRAVTALQITGQVRRVQRGSLALDLEA